MNVLAPNQVNITSGNMVYKNSPFSAFIAFLVMATILGVLIALWVYGSIPMEVFVFSGLFMIIFLFVFFISFLKPLNQKTG